VDWIIAKATAEDMGIIRQWITKLDVPLRTVLVSDAPLESFENKNQTVQKFFHLKNYSPSQMAQVIEPLLSESGYLSAEESTRTLLVMDTVENLIRIRGIIDTFDVPEAEQTVPQIFEIRYGDPAEIVQLIRILLSDESSGTGSSRNTGRNTIAGRTSSRNTGNIRVSNVSYGGSFRATTSSSMVGASEMPVVLIPLPERKWIIARAPAEAMKQIEEWIIKLDQKEPIEKEYESVAVKYVDVTEAAERINSVLTEMPGQEITKSVLVQPLQQARQIMIFGREDLRQMVKKLIAEIDIPPGLFETKMFQLTYADPDKIKENLESLYETEAGSFYSYNYSYNRYSRNYRDVQSQDTVRVISFPTMQQITVIASPENMITITKQIEEWDVPLDVESLKPRIIELKNVDPAQMASLLTTLFSEEAERGMSYYDFYYGTQEDKQKIVGPLYGQLTFEDVPGTKKIIVISNIAAAYDIVEALIHELDKEEMAEVPRVVTLKFADPEKLCEILNAMFCEAGSTVEILRSATGLSQYSMDDSSSEETDTSEDGYTPWWSSAGARTTTDTERPISNVIGKIRFVPESRTKSILVLSPPEFLSNIENLIAELDVPGKQVMIKAVIIEIDHKNLSSLGVQLASNSSAFGALEENAVLALNAFQQLDRHGAVVFGAGGNQGRQFENTFTADVYGLIDFLQKKVNAKILNQQTLWTEDNEEASFFKGQRVAFFTSASTSATAGNVQNFEFQKVGMNLAVRPSITPNKDVDMIVNIILSQLTTDEKNGQPVRTEMETKTNMIVGDGQTLMLGGILFQQDSFTKRGVPGLSDIPILGGLFSHKEKALSNNELIVFITPYVINDAGENTPETQEQIDAPKEKLENVRKELDATMEGLKKMKM
jgi:general secretion pathway protein D